MSIFFSQYSKGVVGGRDRTIMSLLAKATCRSCVIAVEQILSASDMIHIRDSWHLPAGICG